MAPPTPRKPERPVLWIVAGPNGCGKSTAYNRTDIEGWGGSVWIINPDLLTAKIVESERNTPESANLAAVQRIERWLEASIEAYQTIGVETVLSSGKYRRLVELAISRGFEVRMIYIVLASVKLQLARIAGRVAEGGHDVPPEKVAARRLRSFEQLAWFGPKVDCCWIFDNSTGRPREVGRFVEGKLVHMLGLPRDMLAVLRTQGVKDTLSLVTFAGTGG